jgi:hypothetical protein
MTRCEKLASAIAGHAKRNHWTIDQAVAYAVAAGQLLGLNDSEESRGHAAAVVIPTNPPAANGGSDE